jgi:hypothetical protein
MSLKGLAVVQMVPVDCRGVKEAELEESWSLASIPLGSAAHTPTPLMTLGYLVWAGGCRRTLSLTIHLLRGLEAHGPTPGYLVWAGGSSSNESRRSRDAAGAFFVRFASGRSSGLPHTATGAASAKLMMESIRRIRVNIRCRRIFVGYVTETR